MTAKYLPITQQPYCCVPACIQMIMYRHSISLVPQEDLAYEMGLIVPEKDAKLFSRVRTGDKPTAGWGTQIQKPKYDLNTVFEKRDIPFVVDIDTALLTEDMLRGKLVSIQEDDGDALLCFDYRVLWGGTPGQGHVCVFDRIQGDEVWMIDPERDVPKYRRTTIQQLAKAIDFHGPQNTCGVWQVTRR